MTNGRWQLAHGRSLEFGADALVMGILNVTPDSFADGGRYFIPEKALEQAARMRAEGAAIIDIGGESTRPGGQPVTAAEEQARILPIVEALVAEGAIVSIDTYRAETARLAVAAETGAGLLLMHTGRERQKEPDVIADQLAFLEKSIGIARAAGVTDEAIVLDPGFGFAKETPADNLELMARFEELTALGFPLAVGTSRKRFVGAVTGKEPDDRDVGTAATSVILRLKGAVLFRVHNVAINVDALKVADAMLAHA